MKTTQAPNISKPPDAHSSTFYPRACSRRRRVLAALDYLGHSPCSEMRARDTGRGRVLLLPTQRAKGGPRPYLKVHTGAHRPDTELSGHVPWTLCFAAWRYLGSTSVCHSEAGSRTRQATVPAMSLDASSLRSGTHWVHPQHGPALVAKRRNSSCAQK